MTPKVATFRQRKEDFFSGFKDIILKENSSVYSPMKQLFFFFNFNLYRNYQRCKIGSGFKIQKYEKKSKRRHQLENKDP